MKRSKHIKAGNLFVIVPAFDDYVRFNFDYYLGWIIQKVTKGAHVGFYIDDKYVLDNSYHVGGVRHIKIKDLMNYYKEKFGNFKVHILKPKDYPRYKRKKVIELLLERKKIKYSGWHTIRMAIMNFHKHKEPKDISRWGNCSTYCAWILKKSKVKIGRIPSLAWTPGMFLKKKFIILDTINYKE